MEEKETDIRNRKRKNRRLGSGRSIRCAESIKHNNLEHLFGCVAVMVRTTRSYSERRSHFLMKERDESTPHCALVLVNIPKRHAQV